MVGMVVSIEKDFIDKGCEEVMEWNKKLISILGHQKPRLLLGYSILLYFTNKVQDIFCTHNKQYIVVLKYRGRGFLPQDM